MPSLKSLNSSGMKAIVMIKIKIDRVRLVKR